MKNESEILDEATVGAARWHGALDGMYKQLVYGWAVDRNRPDARVIVEICRDDVPIACILADVARTDLAAELEVLGAPDLCHGFVADLGALPASSGGVISARVANTEVTLTGGFRLEESKTPPAAAINNVVGDGGLRLHGWALDPADQKRTVTVRAFVGNEMVAQAAANIIHPSMRGYIDGAHGFDLALPASLADGAVHSVRVVDDEGRSINGSPLTICCSMDGLVGLLPDDADELLLKVADIYQRHLPRSLPMSAWPEWSARFDREGPTTLPALTTAVIVTGEADAEALERTLASLESQHGMTVQVFSDQPFAALLAQALASNCDVLCCVRTGDTLARHALAWALEGFALPQAQVVYTDSETNGTPWFKPAWNPDYALASDYPLDLLLVRATTAKCLLEVHDAADFAWSALAAAWSQGSETIVHVPRVLLQRASPPDAAEQSARLAAATRALAAVSPQAVLEELDSISPGSAHSARRVRHPLPTGARELTVSLVIPTRDRADLLQRCIDTIRHFTDWPKLEIVVIDNGSAEAATHAYFAAISAQGVRVLPMPGPFNYADLNNRAIAQASGDIIGLVNNDIEALHSGWLDEIMAQLLRPNVGAVGAKLLWPNGMVQHGGVLLGVGNVAGHFGNRLADADWGDHGRNQLVQQVSGCTAACLFLRKTDYLQLGGMDANAFPVAFNDVDLCLKVRASGKAIVWTPYAKLLHAESASRGHEDTPQKKARAQREVDQLRMKWRHVLMRDPAYHPALNLDPNSHAFGGVALPPRERSPRRSSLPSER
ncbi:glycosyltransferase family 2 protein [Massilia sp. CFBP9026]|uniref:glycosyltransferase family 2 protein n=1 Tax=Massilia sp. CFBP9026 TaxID=3096536 RepID=UPI002A6A5A5C|nr:glycosyltransferase [Massilia sp. CFBP9026]MDY0962496.1 glycosyltransferase [Massilia sp. CFBP9026]